MCRPCEAADAPGAVKVVWQLVDEYTLMEAERAMLKLLRGLDKHLQHLRQAAAGPNASESPDAEPAAPDSEQAEPAHEVPDQHNSMPGLHTAQPVHEDGSTLNPAMPEMWENPLAVMDGTVQNRQQLAYQRCEYSLTNSAPGQPQQGAQSSGVTSQAVSGVAGHQMPDQAIMAQSPGPSSDQQTRRSTWDARQVTGDARRITGDARLVTGHPRRVTGDPRRFTGDARHLTGDPRRVTGDARRMTGDTEAQRVTHDVQLPTAGSTHVTFTSSASGRKEKLEYRLSHDDVYSPTPEEVQALLQQGLLDTQQQQQQLASYAVAASSDVASNMQSSVNGLSEGGRSAAASIVADASVNGLSGSQAGACLQQEEPNMLSLIAKVKDVQVCLLIHGAACCTWRCLRLSHAHHQLQLSSVRTATILRAGFNAIHK